MLRKMVDISFFRFPRGKRKNVEIKKFSLLTTLMIVKIIFLQSLMLLVD
jgi:hypothetical protein